MIVKNHKGALLTINHKATGVVWIRRLKYKDANTLYLKAVNIIKPIRQYFPKGCDFEKITPKQIANVERIIITVQGKGLTLILLFKNLRS